ncbi:MAG: hypothetical protein ACP6KW_02865 [Candidatus Thorarchaeota archaeon]
MEFVHRTDGQMKASLFLEPRGRVREEVPVYSTIPSDMQSFKMWKTSWLTHKEYGKWKKGLWPEDLLGRLIPGKILSTRQVDGQGKKPFRGPIIAYRSFIIEAGSKKKLPLVVLGRLKKHVGPKDFEGLALNDEQRESLTADLKQDVWAPIAAWHPQPVSRKQKIEVSEVLQFSVRYARAMFFKDLTHGGWERFIETEAFK